MAVDSATTETKSKFGVPLTGNTGSGVLMPKLKYRFRVSLLNNFGGSNETFIAPRYTKIGRLVTVSCQLQIGSFPSDGSTFALSGLPYTCKNAGGTTFGTVPFRQTNSNIMGLTIGDNNTVMEMYGLDDGGGQFNYNDFGQSKQMAFVAQYETD